MYRKSDPNPSPSNARFLHEIQTLSKALSLDPKSRRLSLPSDPKPDPIKPEPDPKPKPKISSLFNWKKKNNKPLATQTRFDCKFTLRVHSIEGLPPSLSNSALIVQWRRSSDPSGVKTRPVKAVRGSARFEESLSYGCSVCGSRSAKTSGLVKYESREFLVYATVAGATGFDLGKTRVELTRILPLNLEELDGEKSSGEWSTSLQLGGKARGAILNVSFGYCVNVNGGNEKKGAGLRRVGSVNGVSFSGGDKARVLREVQFGKKELEIDSKVEQCCTSLVDPLRKNEGDELEFTVIEKGVEIDPSDRIAKVKLENVDIEVLHHEKDLILANHDVELERADNDDEVDRQEPRERTELIREPMLKDLELVNHNGPIIGLDGLEFARVECELEMVNNEDEAVHQEPREGSMQFEDQMLKDLNLADYSAPVIELDGFESPRIDFEKISSSYKAMGIKSKSLSLDDVSENIASEFLTMLGLENSSGSDSESPREQLWKQFEKENLAVNDGIFGPDPICSDFPEDFNLSSMVHDAEMEYCKLRAQMVEDAETEALMREWGLKENVFESSQAIRESGFGSPIDLPLDEPQELPPLGEQVGPFLQTKDGGFLRSLSPSLFKPSKNGGSLVMQASSPIVVPAEMGSDIMEILQGLASMGVEKLSMQASKLMPLEDITGKTMRQVAWEATPSIECERLDMLKNLASPDVSDETKKCKGLKLESSRNGNGGSEFVSLEDLAPLAMDKIEALSIEGLRIQSGMSDEDAPSNISPQFIGATNNSRPLGLEGAGGLQLLDVKDRGGNVDGLMGLSITLDEWMRLDSGVVNEEDDISARTTKVLAAHHAKSTDFLRTDKSGEKCSRKRWGLLGNNFTVALMVQLRDPLRNYEPVGSPMLALIQVERVFIPPKPKIYRAVFESSSEQDDELETKQEPVSKEDNKAEDVAIPQFKITEVHVAGLKIEPSSKQVWGNPVKQQSGSRWLLANGMGKSNKHPFMKSNSTKNPSQATTKVQAGDSLWSISSRIHGNEAKWKEFATLNPHIRNPNVIFPNKTIRLC